MPHDSVQKKRFKIAGASFCLLTDGGLIRVVWEDGGGDPASYPIGPKYQNQKNETDGYKLCCKSKLFAAIVGAREKYQQPPCLSNELMLPAQSANMFSLLTLQVRSDKSRQSISEFQQSPSEPPEERIALNGGLDGKANKLLFALFLVLILITVGVSN